MAFCPPLLLENLINLECRVYELHLEYVYPADSNECVSVEKDVRRPEFGVLRTITLNQASLEQFGLG